MLPSTFRPKTAPEFIGPAQRQATFLAQMVKHAAEAGSPLSLMLLGQPGIGKSQLAAHTVRELGANKWSTHKLNGTQVRIEELEKLAAEFRMSSLFEGYRVLWIEEIDKVPTMAQVRLLTLLDDLPPKTAVVGTSNCKIEDFEIRFQRRFTVLEVKPPSISDIFQLLTRLGVNSKTAGHIANFCGGNVGQALKDADTAFIEQMQLAA